MIKKISLYIAATLLTVSALAQSKEASRPKLVVNIVVSGMRAVDIERYQTNFGVDGFKLLYEKGMRYSNCQYNYQQTTTPVSLATLTTGSQPSTHGIVGQSWFDYVTNEKVDLLIDPTVDNIEYSLLEGGYSPRNLTVPTLGDALMMESPLSKSVTIALEPTSAIIMSGKSGMPFWFDDYSCNWASSESYMSQLPSWTASHNQSESDIARCSEKWSMSLHSVLYVNACYNDTKGGYLLGRGVEVNRKDDRRDRYDKYYKHIASTPIGNDIVASYAKLAVTNLDLGDDENVDLLNICFDASRNIIEKYGPESIEAEDMYYKLDKAVGDLITHIDSHVKEGEVIYVITSDSGMSPSVAVDKNRFNSRQFEVILNGFLSVRYGNSDWVLGCQNGAVYLNHNTIYKHDLNLAEVQNEAATFALQLQGVSHAVTSTALSSSYFGYGHAQKIQCGFYPRRSGDVILNLMPNWIEKDASKVSQSGSMYNYDRAVPLIIYGMEISPKVISRPVDAVSIASTIASIMHISEPAAAEGEPLIEITQR